MATRGYPENPMFKSLTESAYKLGKQMNQSRRRTPIDLSRFEGVRNAVAGAKTTGTSSGSDVYNQFVKSGTKTTDYGQSTRFESFHPGIDLANKENTPIPSFTEGVVSEVGQGQKGWGNFVTITDSKGSKWRFSHLKNSLVRVGQKVAPGSTVGTMGHSGNVYSESGGLGTHLDLRIRDIYNQYQNPSTYLSQY